MTAILVIIVIAAVSEFASYLLCRRNKDIREIINSYLNRPHHGDIKTLQLRYAEHPFLAYSLSPEFRNSFGEKIHNKFGFRDSRGFDDTYKGSVIYCAGDSSTYCNFIERNESTWPDIMEGELKATLSDKEIRVVNGGCGAWTSYQSLIRFSAWVDILKPKLVVIYHGKTDFIPFINGNTVEKEIFPDYGNVMSSLRFDLPALLLAWIAGISYTGKVVYAAYINYKYDDVSFHVYDLKKPKRYKEIMKSLARITEHEWEFIISRYRSFAAMCKSRGIPALFVTQKGDSKLYEPYMNRLNNCIRALESQTDGIFVYDFDKEVNNDGELLYDSVHFTENGCRVCARSISNYISNNIPYFMGRKEKMIAGASKSW